MIFDDTIVVNFIQLMQGKLRKRYTVFLEKSSLCLPVSMFIYMLLLENMSANKYWNSLGTGTPLVLYAFEALKIDELA